MDKWESLHSLDQLTAYFLRIIKTRKTAFLKIAQQKLDSFRYILKPRWTVGGTFLCKIWTCLLNKKSRFCNTLFVSGTEFLTNIFKMWSYLKAASGLFHMLENRQLRSHSLTQSSIPVTQKTFSLRPLILKNRFCTPVEWRARVQLSDLCSRLGNLAY